MTTPADAAHLRETFYSAARAHPDIMEPYVTRLEGVEDEAGEVALMRQALAETIRQRYPLPHEPEKAS